MGFIKFSLEYNCKNQQITSAQYLLQKDDGLDTTELQDRANNNRQTLEDLLAQARTVFNDAQLHCTPSIGIKTKHNDLIRGFTSPEINLKVVALAMIKSSDKYYDPPHPTQDFPKYVALLEKLLEPFKVAAPIEMGVSDWKVVYDHNEEVATINSFITKKPAKPESILTLEREHEKAVNIFLDISTQNPEFSFGEVMLLGMIAFFDPAKKRSSNRLCQKSEAGTENIFIVACGLLF